MRQTTMSASRLPRNDRSGSGAGARRVCFAVNARSISPHCCTAGASWIGAFNVDAPVGRAAPIGAHVPLRVGRAPMVSPVSLARTPPKPVARQMGVSDAFVAQSGLSVAHVSGCLCPIEKDG